MDDELDTPTPDEHALERKLLGDVDALPTDLKAPDVEGRTVRGYASVFGVLDRHGDIVMPGAFAESIATRAARIRYLWQHNQAAPLAVPTVLQEDATGLYFEATLPEGPRQDQALADIKAGLVTGVSIGFFTKAFETFEDDKLRSQLVGWARYAEMRRITNVELIEFSSVTFPSNEAAQVIDVRDVAGGCRKRLLVPGWRSADPKAEPPTPTPPTPTEPDFSATLRAIADDLRDARCAAELRALLTDLRR